MSMRHRAEGLTNRHWFSVEQCAGGGGHALWSGSHANPIKRQTDQSVRCAAKLKGECRPKTCQTCVWAKKR